MTRISFSLLFLLCTVSLPAALAGAAKSSAAQKVAAEPSSPPRRPMATVVTYRQKDIIPVRTMLRFTTLIVLPEDEKILDFTTGDKEFWVIDGIENIAFVKPARAGAQTNMNLIAASGNIYSFVLSEISESPEVQAELKVFVERADTSMRGAAQSRPRFVSAKQVDNYRQQIEIAKAETRQVKQSAEDKIDAGISRFIRNVRFAYRFAAGKKPFYVRAMYHDGQFTYIQARPEETPTLYELKDGKPNLVNFEYTNGVYVVDKVLDRGYLAIGKEKLSFASED